MNARAARCWTRSPAKFAAAFALSLGSLAAGVAGIDASGPRPQQAHEQTLSLSRRIDINTASMAELRLLPGVGPAIAGRIVEHRRAHGPFADIASLDDVRGIGPKTLEKIRPYAVVSPR